MKVLHIIAGGERGGAERFFVRLTLGLCKVGIEQSVVTRDNPQWRDIFAPKGIAHYKARFCRWFPFKTNFIIKRAVKEFKPDVVLTWMARASHFGPKGNHVLVSRLGGYYNLKYFKKSDYLIGNTQDIVDYIVANNWDKSKVKYLSNFAEMPSDIPAAMRDQYDTPQNVPLIFALGRLHDHKGFDVLISAMSKVQNAHLWLAGTGPLENQLKAQAATLGLSERIHFLGWQYNPSQFFKAADIFVCPSRHEPLGSIVIESWIHELPVVATASEGPSSLITDGIDGLLTVIDDVDELASAINKLIDDKSLRKNLVDNALINYEKNHCESKIVSQYIDFFQSIIKN